MTREEALEQLTEELSEGVVRQENGIRIAISVPAARFCVSGGRVETQTFTSASEAAKHYLEQQERHRELETTS